ncbi:MAG: peptide ABC transporter substrate-binding protein [Chloroflexota bacterium]|nr:peptide ABC transporter substrate-binding protein [Chloroflexota bacterium]
MSYATRRKPRVAWMSRLVFGLIAIMLVQTAGIAAAQDATPSASPVASPQASPQASPVAGGGPLELAEIPRNPGREQPGAVPDATMTLNLGNEVTTIDPQVTWFVIEIGIASKVYVPLLQLNEENALAGGGADGVTVSGDGMVYTFHIREGMTYSDGQPVTAANYAYAIKRACSPAVAGNYSNILYAVDGCQAWREADPAAGETAALEAAFDEAVVAIDDQTLEVHLAFGAGYFPYVMTTWVTYPVREDLVGDDPEWWRTVENYVGNGPFRLTRHVEDQEWVFERNDSYFRGAPGIQTLIYRIVTSAETELLAYQQGEFDMIAPSSTLLPQIEGDPALSAQLLRSVGASTSYIGFNNAAAPFDNLLVRQAFAAALNREQYVQQVLNGVNVPAGTFLHEGVPGYQTEYQQTYDPERAQQLLAEAGYPEGQGFPTLQLYYNSESAVSQQVATYWAQSLQQTLGVTIEPTPIDVAQLSEMIASRDPQLIIWFNFWVEDYPHPQNWLSMVFGPGSTTAPLGWENQEFFDLVTRADTMPLEEALPLYSRADALLAEQAPVAFTIHSEGLVLISPQVQGYVTYPTDVVDMRYQIEKIYMVAE